MFIIGQLSTLYFTFVLDFSKLAAAHFVCVATRNFHDFISGHPEVFAIPHTVFNDNELRSTLGKLSQCYFLTSVVASSHR